MSAPSIYSIDAGLPFAEHLARGVLALAKTPEVLARALILLPSRRGAKALQGAFLNVSGGKAMLLPRMLPIGDIDDELYIGEPLGTPFLDSVLDLPPAISKVRRQLLLAQLLRNFRLGDHCPTQSQAMLLAESLSKLLDQLYNADASASELRDLLPEAFSAHWQDILTLLTILINRWPAILIDEGVMDAVDRRNRLIRWYAQNWRQTPPQNLIIVAGSTGSIKATRELIATVARLPNGHIVLPGLDRGAELQWSNITEDSGHPQYVLADLLISLKLEPSDVQNWPAVPAPTADQEARRYLIREVFRPAALTAAWQRLGDSDVVLGRNAIKSLKIITAKNRREEASAIALCLREALEVPEKTAAVITPDRQLAELVIAELQRWKILIEDSAGVPLVRTPIGRFLHLMTNAVANDFAPLALLSLLKHPYAAGGMKLSSFKECACRLELAVLRGTRPAIPALEGLLASVKDKNLKRFIMDNLLVPMAPLICAWTAPNPTLSSLFIALAESAEMLASDEVYEGTCQPDREKGALRLWGGADGKVAARLFSDIEIDARDYAIESRDFSQIFRQILETETVYPHGIPHPRLAILGPVEARMYSADRVVIAGFNEGNWPPRAVSDPWMNSAMRATVGLPPRNWRTSLSAHDVYMAICGDEVILTRSAKQDNTATIKSRWLQRLEVVARAAGISQIMETGHLESSWLKKLQPEIRSSPISRPQPCPPVHVRPRQFSATEIDLWVTDPYALYAKKILKLKPLDPIDRMPDAALRGTLMHAALAKFVNHFSGPSLPDDALPWFIAAGREVFAPHFGHPSVRYFWWPRFKNIAAWVVKEDLRRRQVELVEIHAEIKGEVLLDGPGGLVKLTARADRIEKYKDGSWTIIDYKTGSVPSANMVEKGIRNQLSVEALIAFEGGFKQVPSGQILKLEYWQISGAQQQPASIKEIWKEGFSASEMSMYLQDLIATYDLDATCYPSEPVPHLVPQFRPYRHLARCSEWRVESSDE